MEEIQVEHLIGSLKMEFKMRLAACTKQEDGQMDFNAQILSHVVTVLKAKDAGLLMNMMSMKLSHGEESEEKKK